MGLSLSQFTYSGLFFKKSSPKQGFQCQHDCFLNLCAWTQCTNKRFAGDSGVPKLPCCEFTSLSCSARETSIEKDLISLEALSWTIWKICNQDNSPGTHVPQRMNPDPPSEVHTPLVKLNCASCIWQMGTVEQQDDFGMDLQLLLCSVDPPGAPKRGDIRKKV